jgi:DNA-binding transcriptional ArsR family regulator
MEKGQFLKLTNAVYKVLEFFPESDPLKNRAKDKALAIMENLVLINETKRPQGWATLANTFAEAKIKSQILEDIDILLGYLWIGKSQGWLNSSNCLIISNEYDKIKKEIAPTIESTIEFTQKLPGLDAEPVLDKVGAEKEASFDISDRQTKILDFLTKNEKAQVMDLQTILPDVTKRTIRRDLDELLEAGKITRQGDFNEVFYKIKINGLPSPDGFLEN